MKLRSNLGTLTWNIGFANCSPEKFINKRTIGRIQWLKHPYNDRFFADPFILSVSDKGIKILVEELEFKTNKGRICLLVVDPETKELISRKSILELSTHLSYPAVVTKNNRVYVYPENSESGSLAVYEYDIENDTVSYVSRISDEGLVDATIFKDNELYYMFATKLPNSQERVFLYCSSDLLGNYQNYMQVSSGKHHSRPAGNLLSFDGKLYRPSQNCCKRYGANIEIMEVLRMSESYEEKHVFSLKPTSLRYNLGLHTINFHNDLCVIDGKGYLYPIIGRMYNYLRFLYYKLKNLK